MAFPNKVIIAVNFTAEASEIYRPLQNMSFLNDSEIHLIHVFPTVSYGLALEFGAYTYPVQDDRSEIERKICQKLTDLKPKILPHHRGKVFIKCLFDENPKEKFCQYVTDMKADMAIVATRKKKGIFESSFAQYLNKHSSAHLLVIRPHE